MLPLITQPSQCTPPPPPFLPSVPLLNLRSLDLQKDGKRADEGWWEETLKPLRCLEASSSARPEPLTTARGGGAPSSASSVLEAVGRLEDREISERVTALERCLPSTVEGFKGHALYVLKRHIGKYQGLKEGTRSVGLHRGEPYYPREALSELHTADRWKREGRIVREKEIGKPAKVVKRRKMSQGSGGGRGQRQG